MNELLNISDLTKTFRSLDVETTALDSINLKIQQGEFVAIMGPSGCGKSTLLNILGLLDRPNNGEYLFEGEKAFPATDKQRDEIVRVGIGFIFQQFNLIDDLSIFDNVQLPLYYKKMTSRKRKNQVDKVLDEMGIGHRASHKPQQLSGGQQQRVAIARAMANDPEVILADEPTGNLDSKTGALVMKLLGDMKKQGKTVVMITHDAHLAKNADRVAFLKDGEITTTKKR